MITKRKKTIVVVFLPLPAPKVQWAWKTPLFPVFLGSTTVPMARSLLCSASCPWIVLTLTQLNFSPFYPTLKQVDFWPLYAIFYTVSSHILGSVCCGVKALFHWRCGCSRAHSSPFHYKRIIYWLSLTPAAAWHNKASFCFNECWFQLLTSEEIISDAERMMWRM